MSDRPEWFAPKRYGYGASLPIAWQGWLLLLGYIVLLVLASRWLRPPSVEFWSVVVTLTLIFTLIAKATTRGEWRWRWGEDD